MSDPYEELLSGEWHLRVGPGGRHERICARLHQTMLASVANLAATRLLPVRDKVRLGAAHAVRPDIALVTTANEKLWLAVEVVNREDHHVDTVIKKQIYEDMRVPRLWMADPRYDNVEVYHTTPHGMSLKAILTVSDVLEEPLLPEFHLGVRDLFAD